MKATSIPNSSSPAAWASRKAASTSRSPMSVDFLGQKTLKDLLGSLGHASFGAHDTRDLATGVETTGAAKQYEFGDTMTRMSARPYSALSAARRRQAAALNLEYERSGTHQSGVHQTVSTVLMLDCSHSMILYGEGSIHAGQESRAGPVAFDPHAVSRRFAALRSVPRFSRRATHRG